MKADIERPNHACKFTSVVCNASLDLCLISYHISLRVNTSTLVYQNNKGMYNNFCRKKAAVLLCTDIAARELDFPTIHWVVQLNCPEDATNWIHSAGSWRYFVPKIQK